MMHHIVEYMCIREISKINIYFGSMDQAAGRVDLLLCADIFVARTASSEITAKIVIFDKIHILITFVSNLLFVFNNIKVYL